MATFEELQAKVTKRRETVPVLLDAELLSEHAALEATLAEAIQRDATLNRPPQSPALAAQLEALEAKIANASERFVVEGVGATAWYELLAAHPPSKEERKLGFDHDWRTFRPAALAASCVDPELTYQQAEWLMASLPAGEWDRLWSAVSVVNRGGGGADPKSDLIAVSRLLSKRSSATPPSEGSLAEPSSGDSDEPSPTTSTTTSAA